MTWSQQKNSSQGGFSTDVLSTLASLLRTIPSGKAKKRGSQGLSSFRVDSRLGNRRNASLGSGLQTIRRGPQLLIFWINAVLNIHRPNDFHHSMLRTRSSLYLPRRDDSGTKEAGPILLHIRTKSSTDTLPHSIDIYAGHFDRTSDRDCRGMGALSRKMVTFRTYSGSQTGL